MREERGWTRADVYELTDWQLNPNELGLIEGEYGPGLPFEIEHLTTLAVLFGCRPGELLDREESVVYGPARARPLGPLEVIPLDDAEALARAVSASLTHGEKSPLEAALTVYLSKHPWSDL